MDWAKAFEAREELKHFGQMVKELDKYEDPFGLVNAYAVFQVLTNKYNYTINELTDILNATVYKGNLKMSRKQKLVGFLNVADFFIYQQYMRGIFINIVWLMLVIGVLGNLLVVVYFVKMHKKSLKKMSSYHFLLVILAVVDGVYCSGITLDTLL